MCVINIMHTNSYSVKLADYQRMYINFIDCTAMVSSVDAQDSAVYINTTLNNSALLPGDEVVFYCITRNSSILAWDCEGYTGSGGNRLELYYLPGGPTLGEVNHTAFAYAHLVISGCNNETGIVLGSQLRIIAQENTQELEVSCINTNMDVKKSIKLKVSRKFSMELGISISMILYRYQ